MGTRTARARRVFGLWLLRSRPAAIVLLVAVTALLNFGLYLVSTVPETAVVVAAALVIGAAKVTILIRFGLLAFVVSEFVYMCSYSTATTAWTAWHEQPGLIMLVTVGLLAAYGFWALWVQHSV